MHARAPWALVHSLAPQAIGRAIRHKNDFGAIILLDARFDSGENAVGELSKWARGHVRSRTTLADTAASLRRFFSDLTFNPPRDAVPATPTHSQASPFTATQPSAATSSVRAALTAEQVPVVGDTVSYSGPGSSATAVDDMATIASIQSPAAAIAAWIAGHLGVSSRAVLVGPQREVDRPGHRSGAQTSALPDGASQGARADHNARDAARAATVKRQRGQRHGVGGLPSGSASAKEGDGGAPQRPRSRGRDEGGRRQGDPVLVQSNVQAMFRSLAALADGKPESGDPPAAAAGHAVAYEAQHVSDDLPVT